MVLEVVAVDAPGRSVPVASRRAVLGGAGALVTLLAVSGCARPEGPDELEAPLAAARADVVTAGAAVAAFPQLAGRLTPLRDARRAHADALAAEVRRARPDRRPAVDAAAGATPSPAPPPVSAEAAVTALRGTLGTARDAAGALALTTASYRCGLLTSVAASCAGYATVLAS